MKHLFIIILLCITPSSIVVGDETKGHIAFFMLIPENNKDYAALFEDYNYYYSNVLPWLTKNKYSHSQHTSSPINIKNISLSKKDLNIDIGAIIIRDDKSYKIVRGIITDIDLITVIKEFYKNGT